MKWGKIGLVLKFVAGVAGAAIPAVAKVEKAAEDVAHLNGKQKQDAVVELVKASLEASEDASGKDLLNDPAVEGATRNVIDAVVNLHNVAAKSALSTQPAAALGVHAGSQGD